MGFRDTLNRNPALGAACVTGILLIATWLTYSGLRAHSPVRKDRDFYTIDEGATSFVDLATREPPFDHDGAEAVRVHYFTCDGGRTRFVGWLEKFSPQAKVVLDSATHDSKGNLKDLSVLNSLGWDSKPMVKRPSDGRWYKRHEKEYDEITSPQCPEGVDPNLLTPVEP